LINRCWNCGKYTSEDYTTSKPMDRAHVNIYHTSLVDLGVRYMKAVMAAVAMAEIHAVVV
jgi:DNA-directed RNA polymerase subunit N (RpoN/RPB10)